MPHEQIPIAATDGEMTTHIFTPEGDGPWPAVILFTDAFSIRPASIALAERLAGHGYVVAMPDFYYRYGPHAPLVPADAFPNKFGEVIGPLAQTTSYRKAAEDAGPLLDHLDGRADVSPKRYGMTGYCMGGAIALTAAGLYGDRIAVAASFHGGGLASDDPGSPHLLASGITSEIYIGVADKDGTYPPEMAERLQAALDEAGVTYTHTLYPGSLHGWTQTDFPIYDEPAAERHWDTLIALLKRTIG